MLTFSSKVSIYVNIYYFIFFSFVQVVIPWGLMVCLKAYLKARLQESMQARHQRRSRNLDKSFFIEL